MLIVTPDVWTASDSEWPAFPCRDSTDYLHKVLKTRPGTFQNRYESNRSYVALKLQIRRAMSLRMLALATFVVFPAVISATQISEVGNTSSLPSTPFITRSGALDFQWFTPPDPTSRIAGELSGIDAQDPGFPFLSDLFSTDPTSGVSDSAATAFGESEPRGRLTLAIWIVITLGALLKYLTSPAFYEHLSDASFMFFAIENEGRDLKTEDR